MTKHTTPTISTKTTPTNRIRRNEEAEPGSPKSVEQLGILPPPPPPIMEALNMTDGETSTNSETESENEIEAGMIGDEGASELTRVVPVGEVGLTTASDDRSDFPALVERPNTTSEDVPMSDDDADLPELTDVTTSSWGRNRR